MPYLNPAAGTSVDGEQQLGIVAEILTRSLRTFRVNLSPRERIDNIQTELCYFASETRFISNDDWWLWRIIIPNDSTREWFYRAETTAIVDYRWQLWEGGVASESWTNETWFNRYRPSSNTTAATIAQADTNSAGEPVSGGTTIGIWRSDAGSGEGGGRVPVIASTPEFVLKPNTTYYLGIYADNQSQWQTIQHWLTEVEPLEVPVLD